VKALAKRLAETEEKRKICRKIKKITFFFIFVLFFRFKRCSNES